MPKLPDGMAQRPVIIPEETAEWFRELAYRTRISQQEHFRRALNEYRDKVEREAQPENDEIDRGLAPSAQPRGSGRSASAGSSRARSSSLSCSTASKAPPAEIALDRRGAGAEAASSVVTQCSPLSCAGSAPACRPHRRRRAQRPTSPSASISSLRTSSATVSSSTSCSLASRTRSFGTTRFSTTGSSA